MGRGNDGGDIRVARLRANSKRRDRAAARFERLLLRVLRRVMRVVLRLLRSSTAGTISVEDLAVMPRQWAAAVDAELVPALARLYVDVAGDIAEQLAATGRDIATVGAGSAEQVMAAARNRLVGIGDDMWEQARDQLVEGIAAGDDIPQLAARLRAVLGVSQARALTIARTETIAASNAATLAQVLVLGDPTAKKEWLATPGIDGTGCDHRTRPSHCAADGQRVRAGDTFTVGGARLMFPGDPTGPPDQIINCRCSIAVDLDDEPVVAAVRDRSGHCHDERGRWTGCDRASLATVGGLIDIVYPGGDGLLVDEFDAEDGLHVAVFSDGNLVLSQDHATAGREIIGHLDRDTARDIADMIDQTVDNLPDKPAVEIPGETDEHRDRRVVEYDETGDGQILVGHNPDNAVVVGWARDTDDPDPRFLDRDYTARLLAAPDAASLAQALLDAAERDERAGDEQVDIHPAGPDWNLARFADHSFGFARTGDNQITLDLPYPALKDLAGMLAGLRGADQPGSETHRTLPGGWDIDVDARGVITVARGDGSIRVSPATLDDVLDGIDMALDAAEWDGRGRFTAAVAAAATDLHLPGRHDQKTHGRRYARGPDGQRILRPPRIRPGGLENTALRDAVDRQRRIDAAQPKVAAAKDIANMLANSDDGEIRDDLAALRPLTGDAPLDEIADAARTDRRRAFDLLAAWMRENQLEPIGELDLRPLDQRDTPGPLVPFDPQQHRTLPGVPWPPDGPGTPVETIHMGVRWLEDGTVLEKAYVHPAAEPAATRARPVRGRDVTGDQTPLQAAPTAATSHQDLGDPLMGGLASQIGFDGARLRRGDPRPGRPKKRGDSEPHGNLGGGGVMASPQLSRRLARVLGSRLVDPRDRATVVAAADAVDDYEDLPAEVRDLLAHIETQPTHRQFLDAEVAVVAATEAHTAAMVALVPSAADVDRLAVPGGEPPAQLHTTLMYLGDAAMIPAAVQASLVRALTDLAEELADFGDVLPVDADGFAVSVFNPPGMPARDGKARDSCVVLGLSGDDLDVIHGLVEDAVEDVFAEHQLPLPEQHAPYQPHITLAYTDDLGQVGRLADRAGPVTFDRLRVAFAGVTTDIPLTPEPDDEMPPLDIDDAFIAAVREFQSRMPAQLQRYWIRKLRLGTPGSFRRCVRRLRKYYPVNPEGLCANLYHEATGRWPGRRKDHADDSSDAFHLPGRHDQKDHGNPEAAPSTEGLPAGGFKGMSPAGPAERDRFRAVVGRAIPPAWTDVFIADDLENASLLARGKDRKGRPQSIYSAAHTQGQAERKFTRIRELAKHLTKLDHAIERDAMVDDNAAALLLIRRLGMRPGSNRDTGADKQAHGATNLLARHVTVDGERVRFDFTGKKGVRIQLETTDPLIAAVMRDRLGRRGPDDPLFATSEARTREYMRSTGVPGEFLLKDLRTVRANTVALREVKARGEAVPKSKAEFQRWRKQVAERVAAQLGNTPALALSSYINPTVFTPWLISEDWA